MLNVEYENVKAIIKGFKIDKEYLNTAIFIINLERLLHDTNKGLFWVSSQKIDISIVQDEVSIHTFTRFFLDKYIDKIDFILNNVETLEKCDILINEIAIENGEIRRLNFSPYLVHQMTMGLIIAKLVNRSNMDTLKKIYENEVKNYDKSIDSVKVFYKILNSV
jgi:hypothetical protein